MPSVAVRSSPNGLPIAIAVSPTCTLRESASGSGVAAFGALLDWMRTTARSLEASVPSTWPSRSVPRAPKRTVTCLELSTTCALVTIVCVLSIRKPVPEPALVRIETTAGTAFA